MRCACRLVYGSFLRTFVCAWKGRGRRKSEKKREIERQRERVCVRLWRVCGAGHLHVCVHMSVCLPSLRARALGCARVYVCACLCEGVYLIRFLRVLNLAATSRERSIPSSVRNFSFTGSSSPMPWHQRPKTADAKSSHATGVVAYGEWPEDKISGFTEDGELIIMNIVYM